MIQEKETGVIYIGSSFSEFTVEELQASVDEWVEGQKLNGREIQIST